MNTVVAFVEFLAISYAVYCLFGLVVCSAIAGWLVLVRKVPAQTVRIAFARWHKVFTSETNAALYGMAIQLAMLKVLAEHIKK
jgi:hypothetical protein